MSFVVIRCWRISNTWFAASETLPSGSETFSQQLFSQVWCFNLSPLHAMWYFWYSWWDVSAACKRLGLLCFYATSWLNNPFSSMKCNEERSDIYWDVTLSQKKVRDTNRWSLSKDVTHLCRFLWRDGWHLLHPCVVYWAGLFLVLREMSFQNHNSTVTICSS